MPLAEDLQDSLRTRDYLPRFRDIDPATLETEVEAALTAARTRIESLVERAGPYTWNNLVMPLEIELDRVARMWAPIRHLHAVKASAELRAAYNECLPKISAFHTELGQHRRLYDAYRSLAEGPEYDQLDATQRKAIDDALRQFRLSGVDLAEPARTRFAQIEAELADLRSRFQDNVLDATNAWRKHIQHPDDLSGLGPGALALAQDNARKAGENGWLLTLEYPLVHAVLTSADNRELREEVYAAWTTRASDQGPHAGSWDNGPIMERIVALRQEKARLLGYSNYADLALEERMVEKPDEVLTFLNDIAGRALPAARAEYAELTAFAAEHYGLVEVAPWDVRYIGEKLRQARYAISDEALKPYFPAPRVIAGLFSIVGELYGITFEAVPEVDVWHEDVTYYRVKDANGAEIAGFYFDLYARPNKRSGAWMDDCVSRLRSGGDLQLPVAFLTCNLMPAVGGQQPQFTHDEVITLFHEFGHGLHHMLTQIDIPSLSGISGVEWDAVELPSQLLENWCWEWVGLDRISGHADTGDPLPADMVECLQETRHFQAALSMLRQVEFSVFDFRLHLAEQRLTEPEIRGILDGVRNQMAVIQPPAYNRFPHAFSHIFTGAYAAGYYSYLWAEVLAADAFEAFQAEGLLEPAVGDRFRRSVLERGGSRPMRDNFREFRGRDPNPEALLRQTGLTV